MYCAVLGTSSYSESGAIAAKEPADETLWRAERAHGTTW